MAVVGPNLINTIRLDERLPLVHREKDAKKFARGTLGHAVFVPSNFGGRLRIGFKDGKFANKENSLAVTGADRDDPQMTTDGSEIVFEIEDGKRGSGVFFVAVKTPKSSYEIYAIYDEDGAARHKNGKPMIPWNFWYYPFADSEKELTAWGSKVLQPIQKYEKAFGRDNVMKWELAFHADPTKTRKDWEGHCHLAAPASILFVRPPDDGREVRGQKFTCEELKYFATEFVGRFGLAERPWQLPSPHPKARTGKFVERKPSEAPKEFGQRDVLIDMLLEIRKALRLNGRAVVMDLRHNKGIEHTQVWNQAIFAYQTTYAQPDVSDLTLIDGITTLFANEDAINPDGTGKGVPADVWSDTNGHVFYDFKAHRESKHRYTLRFSHSGGIETESSDNAWTYAKHDGTDTFAPRHIVLVEPPAKKVILDQGNVRIHPEHVMELLTLREKFK